MRELTKHGVINSSSNLFVFKVEKSYIVKTYGLKTNVVIN